MRTSTLTFMGGPLTGLMSIPVGMPWMAAYSLTALWVLAAISMRWLEEMHRQARFQMVIDKGLDGRTFDMDAALVQALCPGQHTEHRHAVRSDMGPP